jgi:superfamily I DNA/RNA helicase
LFEEEEIKILGNIKPEGKQKEVLALPARGHIVILGTAGSGKTTMALLRAIGLANLPTRPKILVVTFNRALIQYMTAIINTSLHNLRIETYHKFARGYLKSLGKMPDWGGILKPEDKEYYISQALESAKKKWPDESTYRRPLTVFIDEITFMERFGIETLDDYLSAERIGRASVHIKRENRKWFFKVYEEYQRIRPSNYDWDDIALYVYKELKSDNRPRLYEHIIVDEGQDFSPMMIKSLIAAVNENGSFTFFGDVAQQIYGSRLSWRDSGINITDNKIWRFDKNYRNPSTISDFAKDITDSIYWLKDKDMVVPTTPIAKGPKPVLIYFDNKEKELAWLIRQIKINTSSSSNVIICRNHAIVDEIKKILKRNGVFPKIINKNQAGFSDVKDIYISTFHTVKGLEFENVFIPFLCDDIFPDKDVLENAVSEESALADELKLFYVAVTRSKYGLFMSYNGKLSRLFPEESHNYDKIKGEDIL